eukprot:6199332-Pleurochrysis_carterae.AAC.1
MDAISNFVIRIVNASMSQRLQRGHHHEPRRHCVQTPHTPQESRYRYWPVAACLILRACATVQPQVLREGPISPAEPTHSSKGFVARESGPAWALGLP